MQLTDNSEDGRVIEERIGDLRVQGRKQDLNGKSTAHVSWDDFAALVKRTGARVEEDGDELFVKVYTPGGMVRVSAVHGVPDGEIRMDIQQS